MLGGREFVIGLRWSDFGGCFYLTLSDVAGNAVAANVRVVSNAALLVGFLGSELPAGDLWVLDPSPIPADPTLAGLGDTQGLYFVPAEAA